MKPTRAILALVDSVARDLSDRLAEGMVPRPDRASGRKLLMDAWSAVSTKDRGDLTTLGLRDLIRRMDALVARSGVPAPSRPFLPTSLQFPWPIRIRTVSDGSLLRGIRRFETTVTILARRIDFMVEHALRAAGQLPKPSRPANPSAPPPGAGGSFEYELVWGETEGK